jgi:hypothetical protein
MPDTSSVKNLARQKRIDWDGAWKEAIQQLFPAFLQLLFPDVYAIIDWRQEPVFLEQELRQVTRRAKRGKGAVDKLARVLRLDGRQTTLLIHIEFQHQIDLDLPARLYLYNIRIYSLLQEQVITLAVLGDEDPQWQPDQFGYSTAGFETQMRFPVNKLLEYEAQWPMLEQSDNPFAVIVMAHLKALATMGQPETRLEWKLWLARALYDRNYGEERIQQLVDFIDWLMVLDDKREERFDETIRKYEEEKTMPTMSPYQKRFLDKGKQVGQQQGLREALLITLAARFEVVPEDIADAINRIENHKRLITLQRAAVQITTIEEFRPLLAA